jgi:hypothetical protein
MNDKTNKLKELFENFNEITPDSMQDLVGESIKAFEGILAKLDSPDEEEKKNALKEMEQMKAIMEEQAEKALEKAGLNKDSLGDFINNPDNFSPEEWLALQNAKTDLDSYKDELLESGLIEKQPKSPEKKKKTSHHKPKKWISS